MRQVLLLCALSACLAAPKGYRTGNTVTFGHFLDIVRNEPGSIGHMRKDLQPYDDPATGLAEGIGSLPEQIFQRNAIFLGVEEDKLCFKGAVRTKSSGAIVAIDVEGHWRDGKIVTSLIPVIDLAALDRIPVNLPPAGSTTFDTITAHEDVRADRLDGTHVATLKVCAPKPQMDENTKYLVIIEHAAKPDWPVEEKDIGNIENREVGLKNDSLVIFELR